MDIQEKTKTTEFINYSNIIVNPDAIEYLQEIMYRSDYTKELLIRFKEKRQLKVISLNHFIIETKLLTLEVKEIMGSFACRILSQNQTVFKKIQNNSMLKEKIRKEYYPYYDQTRNILFLRGRVVDKNNEPFIVNLMHLNNVLDLLQKAEEDVITVDVYLKANFSSKASEHISFKFTDEKTVNKSIECLKILCLEKIKENKL